MAEKTAGATTAPKSAELRTPAEWAAQTGRFKPADQPWKGDYLDPRHAAADALHAWSHHAYHYQAEPLLLSLEDYEAALKAADEFPLVLAHKPAIAPHSPLSYPDKPAQRSAPEEKV